MERYPDDIFIILPVMKKGLIFFPLLKDTDVSSIPGSPPIPDPMMHPARYESGSLIFTNLLCRKASSPAARENFINSSIFFISFLSIQSSATNDPSY